MILIATIKKTGRGARAKVESPPEILPDMAPYLFHQGTNYHTEDYLGAHATAGGTVFRVWAPNAAEVSLVSDATGWEQGLPLSRVTDAGVWECFCPNTQDGMPYKFRITTHDGRVLYKADPYAFYAELPPATASRLYTSSYTWRDESWLAYRASTMANGAYRAAPINIYELHLGSWLRHEDNTYLSYTQLAGELAPYLKEMGYTHVELMPVMEHPFDGSWGYQVCSYFAPTSRFGTPDEFRAFVDAMHEAGIGVILDWVPAHFPKDAHGLYEFDGGPLYEYQGWDRREHAGWGTRCFDVGRPEVQSFLVSNAVYWVEQFHADGLRVDAVASMLYLDYDRMPGEWCPNVYGDNRNLEAIAFFKKLNGYLHEIHPDVLTIAEESGDFGGVTAGDGLGFSLKWNMGWMNDTLSYAKTDPVYRKYDHNKTTFSLTYAFSEQYVLPISHDEVVHGKKSFLDRMPGDYWQKFAGERVFYAWQMTHPGKKLGFMGNEIGQFREWDYAGQIEWFLLEYEHHAGMQRYFAALNHLYLKTPALYQRDDSWEGFFWIDPDNRDESVLSFRRRANDGTEIIVVLNFTPVERRGFTIGVPEAGKYEEIFNSDDTSFGGSGLLNTAPIESEARPFREYEHTVTLDLATFGAVFLRRVPDPKPAKKPRTRKKKTE